MLAFLASGKLSSFLNPPGFIVVISTPPKLNIATEKWWLEDKPFLLERPVFRGELLNFRGVIRFPTFCSLGAGRVELEPRRQTQVTAPLPSEPVANLVGQGSGESPVGKCRVG